MNRKILTLSLIIVVILLSSMTVLAQKTMGNENIKYIDDIENKGILFKDEEIELNDFRILPVFNNIGFVSDPSYFFEKNKDFPLGHKFFILKIKSSKDDSKYVPVKFDKTGTRNQNDYWIFKGKTYLYGSGVEINYNFIKKEYKSDPQINYLELVITLESEKRINTELEFTNYFLANSYTKGKGFIHELSNYDKSTDEYQNMIVKRWQGELKKAYNVRTYQGENKYQSIEYTMKSNMIRAGLTKRLGKLDLFYRQSDDPKETLAFFEDLFY